MLKFAHEVSTNGECRRRGDDRRHIRFAHCYRLFCSLSRRHTMEDLVNIFINALTNWVRLPKRTLFVFKVFVNIKSTNLLYE